MPRPLLPKPPRPSPAIDASAPSPVTTRFGRRVIPPRDLSPPASNPPSQPSQPPQTPQKVTTTTTTTTKLPAYYSLAPSVPSPFTGSLETSLDAILAFGQLYAAIPGVTPLVTALLEPVSPHTDWIGILSALETATSLHSRYLMTELLFLLTRTLLPEQIAENRAMLERLYDRKKQLAMRLLLRYDMLREWKMEPNPASYREQPVTVASVVPVPGFVAPEPVVGVASPRYPYRRPLLLNVIPTLLAGPVGGYASQSVRDRMRHHVTVLDGYLMLGDEEVEGWSDGRVKSTVCFVLMHWQWLRGNNDTLDDLEMMDWEGLEGKAEECGWIGDDTTRVPTGSSVKKELKSLG
ncbi:hypothetical protein COCVIDRAFT_26178 [Bipolaris victoriae FI3]|uniref:Uncharacterized protein n=1 Tax=Bipolaris victoriae (strain FI3) TaxID=930091 RepID=W7ENP0_BIPV3|nr:hypothetical protein COCVIDRAFT_26178 [Bipolaris victoriae FI3]